MKEVKVGQFVISKSGHDKDKVYIIIQIDNRKEYVYLADGQNKMLDNPKKKNKKHIQQVNCIDETISVKNLKNQEIYDDDIIEAMKLYFANFNE